MVKPINNDHAQIPPPAPKPPAAPARVNVAPAGVSMAELTAKISKRRVAPIDEKGTGEVKEVAREVNRVSSPVVAPPKPAPGMHVNDELRAKLAKRLAKVEKEGEKVEVKPPPPKPVPVRKAPPRIKVRAGDPAAMMSELKGKIASRRID